MQQALFEGTNQLRRCFEVQLARQRMAEKRRLSHHRAYQIVNSDLKLIQRFPGQFCTLIDRSYCLFPLPDTMPGYVAALLEAEGFVAGFDDMAMMRQPIQ